MSKEHRLKHRKSKALAAPINFLLDCSQKSLASFELARLDEVANLRKELHATLDRMIDEAAQAALAGWFRTVSRDDLKRRVLQSPDERIEEIIAHAEQEIGEGQRSEEESADYQPMPMPNIFRPALEPGAAHLAAALRYQERNIAEGKCARCPEPLDPNSTQLCTKHLAMQREEARLKNHTRGKRANPNLEPGTREYLYGTEEVPLSTHGRQPGTLASLAMNREQKTRAVLAELGIPPESAAVTLNVAKSAILQCLPDLKHRAMKAYDLFQKAHVPTSAGKRSTTGYKALKQLLAEGKIQRIGKGSMRDPFRYFATHGSKE